MLMFREDEFVELNDSHDEFSRINCDDTEEFETFDRKELFVAGPRR